MAELLDGPPPGRSRGDQLDALRRAAALLESERAARLAAEARAADHEALNAALRETAGERDRALAAERSARQAVERAERRSAFLAGASAALAASLDYERTLAEVVRLAVPEIADWCVVDLAESDERGALRLRRIAAVHADPTKTELTRRLRAEYPTVEARASHTALRVVTSGESWLDPEVSQARLAAESRDAEHFALMRALGFRTEMVVPLASRGRTLGTITLVGGDGRSYDRDDLELAEELGRRCATAVGNAQAFAAEEQARRVAQRAAERTRRLQEITQRLSRSLDPAEVLDDIARSAAELLEAPVGAVFLLDQAAPDGDFQLAAAHGIDRERELRLPRRRSLAGRAVDEGRTLVIDDVRATPDTALPRLLTGKTAGSEIAAPIAAGDERLGVVKVFSPTAQRFSPDDAALLGALAAAAAAALTNARLFREAQEAIRARDEFVSSAAHDLKSPLTTIKGGAQLLKRQLASGRPLDVERLVAGLAGLDTAATRLARQVDQLLDITRLRAGEPLELRRSETDVVALARQVAADYQQTDDAHAISVEAGPEQLVGHWDRGRIERVIDNLLGNAVKYSPEGGPVCLTIDAERDGRGEWAVIVVRDRGIGIPAAELERIFDRFGRASNVPELIAGSGIGLTSVRQIVEQHGGAVEVASHLGQGSAFTVRLPLRGE